MGVKPELAFLRTGAVLFALLALAGCEKPALPDKSIEVAAQGLYSGALSDDATVAVVGSIVHGGSLWRVETAERLFDWNHRKGAKTEITSVAVTSHGEYAVTVEYSDMVLWNARTGQSLTWFAAPSEILAIDLSPDGRYAILGLADHTAVLFDIRRGGGNLRVFNHQGRVSSVSLSGDGQLLVTGSDDHSARAWNVSSGQLLHEWHHREPVVLVTIAPDGTRAFSVSKYDRAVVWDVQNGTELGVIPLRATAVQRGQTFTAARFSPNGDLLLTGSSDRVVQLWDTHTFSQVAHWVMPKRKAWKPTGAAVLSVAFDADGNRYYALASNGFIHRLKR